MKKLLVPVYILIICSLVAACKKDKKITYDDVPQLSFSSISPDPAKEFEDSISISFNYTDGNGDLGENNANTDNLFVTDTRINITYPFRVQQLSPDNSTIAIKGNLRVILKNTGITNGSSSQQVTYQLYMVDRSGNQSNTISTTPITINK